MFVSYFADPAGWFDRVPAERTLADSGALHRAELGVYNVVKHAGNFVIGRRSMSRSF
jgi:hypothetical protein